MLKYFKPTTHGRRKMSVVDFSILSRKRPEKGLIEAHKRGSGRDRTGQISVRHQGGGSKRQYRVLGSLEAKIDSPAKILHLEYDPNRTAFLVLAKFADKSKMYLLAWEGAQVGQTVVATDKAEIKPGNRLRMLNIPNGIGIFDLEIKPGQGGKLVRSAGATAAIVAKEGDWVQVKMPSGEVRRLSQNGWATIGQSSNISHSAQRMGKAGRRRHLGIRPSVRGKAMHPDAHPHGGGEGVNPIGLKYPKTPWGKHALGVRTRKKHKYSDKMIVQRRKK